MPKKSKTPTESSPRITMRPEFGKMMSSEHLAYWFSPIQLIRLRQRVAINHSPTAAPIAATVLTRTSSTVACRPATKD